MRTGSLVVLAVSLCSSLALAEVRDKDAKPTPKPDASAAELAKLTDDPVTARAERVDGDETKGLVTFTFDDGPNPETTPTVLDALEKYNVPAAFFLVTQRLQGKHGERPREILARMLAAGFLVGSHTATHPNLKKSSSAKLTKEIDGSIRTLAREANRPIGLFRPPFGAVDANVRSWLKKRGLTEVLWSVDTLDWQAKDAERLRKKVFAMITKQDGGVVLMHDVKTVTAKIIGDVLDDLEAENCRRLAAKGTVIVPVSIHYFLKDGKKPRAIPAAVTKRTEAYKAALPGRCAARPKPAATAPPPR